MKTSEIISDIAKAMSIAQNQMKPASKDSQNPHFKSRYSDLSSVWDAIREPITQNGLTIWQDVTTQEKSVSVTTMIVHISGQWIEFGPLCIPLSKFDAQGVGSGISYAKRYALCAAIGVVSGDDDDGEAAVGRPKAKPTIESNNSCSEFIKNNPGKYEYVKIISQTHGKTETEIINSVLSNIDKFDVAYEKWKNRPMSMDEIE